MGDTALQSFLEQRLSLTKRLNGVAKGGGETFNLAAGLAAINPQIKGRSESIIADLQRDLPQTLDTRRAIIETIQGEVVQGELSAQTLADIYERQQEAQIAQRQFDQLKSRMRDVEGQAVLQMASSRLVSETIAPASASFPIEKLVMAVAILGAFAAGRRHAIHCPTGGGRRSMCPFW